MRHVEGWLIRVGAGLSVEAYDAERDRVCWEQRLVGRLLLRAGLVSMQVRVWWAMRR